MRITQEADYALRIVLHLAKTGEKADAGSIADATAVTGRFATKILRKLMLAGIVKSYKGVAGGYALARNPEEISMLDVISTIDGPIQINRCVNNTGCCTKLAAEGSLECSVHNVFQEINKYIVEKLSEVNFGNIDTIC